MIVATGLSGSIGRNLKAAIECNVRLHEDELDMLTKLQVLRPRVIIHLASPTDTRYLESLKEKEVSALIQGSVNLLRSFRESGGEYFLYVSSGHVYGSHETRELLREDDELRGESTYARLKARTEQALIAEADNLQLLLGICRPFSVFGNAMAEHYLATRVINGCQSRGFSLVKNGLDERDFLSPKFVADTIMHIAQKELVGSYNICSGNSKTIEEKVLETCPDWPAGLIEKSNSNVPFLVGCPDKLKKALNQ